MSKSSGKTTGNAGEFSEPLVASKLLVDGQVPVIDSKGNLSGAVISIRGIKRVERGDIVVYIQRGEDDYTCVVNEVALPARSYERLKTLNSSLLNEIMSARSDHVLRETALTYYCPSADQLIDALSFSGLKAKSGEKADLEMSVVDSLSVNGIRTAGFTIKSRLGKAPSLTNSGATIFRYTVSCDSMASLEDPALVAMSGKELIRALVEMPGFRYNFVGVESKVYEQNLRMIDSCFAPMIAAALFHSYHVSGGHFSSIISDDSFVAKLKDISGTEDNMEFFIHKFKDFLKQSALGMQPKKKWLGSNDVTGGALILQSDGQVVCLCTDKDTDFRDYLFDNCRFESPKSGKGENKLCALRKDADGSFRIRLSLQIRFK
jgi:hypothetical protein